MIREGKVFIHNVYAGTIKQDEDGYSFSYDDGYLKRKNAEPVSLTMPLRNKVYKSKTMLPFFDNLIPEGWLLAIAEKNWKLNRNDRMGLLLTVCKDCIGAVHVENITENDNV